MSRRDLSERDKPPRNPLNPSASWSPASRVEIHADAEKRVRYIVNSLAQYEVHGPLLLSAAPTWPPSTAPKPP